MNHVFDSIDISLFLDTSAQVHVFDDLMSTIVIGLVFQVTDEVASHLTLLYTILDTVPTHMPDCQDQQAALLDLCLTRVPKNCLTNCVTNAESPLGNADHVVILVDITINSQPQVEESLLKTTRYFKNTDWKTIRDHIRDAL